MEHEVQEHRQKRINRMLRDSSLPIEKTLDTFQRNRLPHGVDAQLSVLPEDGFLDRHQNVLVFGNPAAARPTC